jgi:hypothetical protein
MNTATRIAGALVIAVASAVLASAAARQSQPQTLGYTDTPLLPGGKWRVHDGARPQPRVVTPGTFSTPERPGAAPSDAIVLFDGADLSRWRNSRGEPAGWKIENGAMVVVAGRGNISTRGEFGDVQLHIEWATPRVPSGDGQGRGNSGVFLMGLYEIQVLDSYQNQTYPDGQAAAIYGQFPPFVNASRPPGEWQAYDIIFTAPRFTNGALAAPAYASVLHNGVVVHHHAAIIGATRHRTVGTYTPHAPKLPLTLQDHGNPTRYRNIWVRTLAPSDES